MHLTFTLADGRSYHAGPFDETAIIGSSEDEASIPLPCESLSPQHAIIEPAADGTRWQIRDLDSARGLSDGTNPSPAFLLVDGSTVFLGDVRLDVSFASPAASTVVARPASVHAPRTSAAASAQVQRLRAAQQRRERSGTLILFAVLGVLSFAAGFAVRYLQ